jgi:predicted nucleotidyltransferase
MQPTTYPNINEVLNHLLSQMQTILDQKLVGLYLYGSLVTGDFDPDTSDIDLLAAISSDLDEAEFTALNTMRNDFGLQHQPWENRLEIAYLSLDALKTFKTRSSKIAIISPGEPFHIKEAGSDWLVNWYIVREKGLTLFGPSPRTIIEPISKEEFIDVVKRHMQGWREWVNEMRSRPCQAYAILTMCRGLYTCRNGEQVSKQQAALWAQQQLPEWAATIQNALTWRQAWREAVADPEATFPETQRFVHLVIDPIER